MLHGVEAVAALGEPVYITCGAEDCEADHAIYEPKQLLLITEGITREQEPVEMTEALELAVEQGTLVRGESLTFPTLLGYWYDTAHLPHKQN
jgi:thiazole synthase ThiGH ThiG subunit